MSSQELSVSCYQYLTPTFAQGNVVLLASSGVPSGSGECGLLLGVGPTGTTGLPTWLLAPLCQNEACEKRMDYSTHSKIWLGT